MPLITCTHCGATGEAPESILGTQVRCSKCKQSFLAGGDAQEPEHQLVLDEEEPRKEPEPQEVDDDPPPAPARKSRRRDEEEDEDEEEEEEDEEERPRRRGRPSRGGDNAIGDYVTFKKFVGPGLITILFWAFSAISILFGILNIVIGSIHSGSGSMSFSYILWGILQIFAVPPALRSACEVGVAVLRSYEAAQEKKSDE